MNVKTADLKNNLSKYLRLVRESGQTIIVCDRDRPVASISPIASDPESRWQRQRTEALARAQQIGLKISIPATAADVPAKPSIQARLAGDERTDVNTAAVLRDGRNY